MGYRVIARFFHKASGAYIDPGQECPPLPVEDVKRLVRARCLVEVPSERGAASEAPPAPPPSRKTRAPRSETPQPPEE